MDVRNKENAFLVIFDFDGVLADSKEAIALQMQETVERLSEKKIPEEEFRKRVGNTDLKKDFSEFLQTDNEEKISQALNLYISLTNKYSYLRELYPGVRQTLEELRKNHFIGLVSRKTQERLNNWLKHFKLTHLFDMYIGTITDSKSEAILKIMDSFDFPSERTYMVGDTEFDILSAQDAGVKSILALYGTSTPEKILRLNPSHTVNNIEEILDIISIY